jgi:hypothetical protein
MMAAEKQLAANRRNYQQSSGPRNTTSNRIIRAVKADVEAPRP